MVMAQFAGFDGCVFGSFSGALGFVLAFSSASRVCFSISSIVNGLAGFSSMNWGTGGGLRCSSVTPGGNTTSGAGDLVALLSSFAFWASDGSAQATKFVAIRASVMARLMVQLL